MKKFIITGDGHLRFGRVYLHRDLLQHGEKCEYGGGLWTIDEGRGAIILYGRSFDFGPPDFDYVRVIEWDELGGKPRPLFNQPHWPKAAIKREQSEACFNSAEREQARRQSHDETLIPIYAKP